MNTLLPGYRETPYPLDLSTPGAGITTITQALVKLLYFEKFTPGIAKLKQTVVAEFALDPLMAKSDQLRLFINTAYLGPSVSGFAQAAEAFFGKSFADLTEDEYISLVAMLRYPGRNRERLERIKQVVARTSLAVCSMSSTASSNKTFSKNPSAVLLRVLLQ